MDEINDLPKKTLLRVDEVALFFKVSKQTIYTWVEFGRLSGCNPSGGCLRIFRDSVIELLKDSAKDL